jgi:gamma-glutamyltranspeptidase / glutathione hydrolase
MRRIFGLLLLLLPCSALLTGQRKEVGLPVRNPSRGLRGAIASGSEPATEAALRMYHRGGNAVDAGVAAMFAASITEFSHFGFGGEAPILIRTKDGKVHAIAGVGTMPKLATADFFRKRRLEPGEVQQLDPNGLAGMVPVAGLMPALVPGMVDAALLSLKLYGTLPLADVMAPAIELAGGMPLDETRAMYIARSRRFFELWPDSKRVFVPEGRIPRVGDIFRQPDLARTMRSMVDAEHTALTKGKSRGEAIESVRDFFYRGDIARRIDAFSRANGGLLRYEDMAAFHLEPEDPVSTNYRGYEVYKPGFWSQGPTMIEALNLLEGFDLRAMGSNTTEYIHTVTEALKLAYADRDTYYGDPKFAKVPEARLLSKEYAAERRKMIKEHASLEFQPGKTGVPGVHPSVTTMAHIHIDDELLASDTTCLNAIDKDGVMFASTPSGAWLPSVIAGDTGIELTERAQSFLLVPGHANELAGGKRPRVTLSPTIVTRAGKPVMTIATPGGDVQEQAQLQLFLDVVEFNMNAEAATEDPRFQTEHLVSSFDNHAMNPGELLLDERIPQSVAEALTQKGHKVEGRPKWASGSAPVLIRVLPNGVIEAGADPYGYRNSFAW